MRKDLLSISDLNSEQIHSLLLDAIDLKTRGWLSSLSQKVLAVMFEKPSLRTRMSFEVAMQQLGGHVIYLSPAEIGLGKRESVPDVARVLSRYVDVVAARTFSHLTLEMLADYSRVPVIITGKFMIASVRAAARIERPILANKTKAPRPNKA